MSKATSVKRSPKAQEGGYSRPERRNELSDRDKLESYGIYRSIARDSVDALVCGDRRGRIIFFNEAAEKLFGYRRDEIIGRSVTNLMPARFRTAHRESLKRVVAGGERKIIGKTVELTALRKDGSEFPVELSLSASETREGPVFISAVRDLSERARNEEALRQSEERSREAERIAHLGSWEWDMEADTLFWSDEVYRIFGLSPQQFAADYNAFLRSIHPDDVERVKEAISKAAREGGPYSVEYRVVRPDGSVRHVHERGEVHFRNKQPARMTGTVLDVTEVRTAEDGLRKLALQNRKLLEATGEGIYGVDAGGRLIFINPAAEDLLGYATDELLGRFSHDIWHHTKKDGSPYPAVECPIVAAHAKGESLRVTGEVFFRKDGTAIPVEYTVNPVMESDVVSGAVVAFSDITERIEAEERVREAGRFLEKIFDSVTDAIFVVDENRQLVNCNSAVENIFGYRVEELTGRSTEVLYPDRRAFERTGGSIRNEVMERGFSEGEILLKRKDGRTFPAWYSASMFEAGGEDAPGIVVTVRDITERKRAEVLVRRIFARNEMILNSTGEGIYGIDLQGKVIFANPAAAAMTGYAVDYLVGRRSHKIFHHSRADGSPYPAEECPIYTAYKDGKVHYAYEDVFWKKDGTSFPVEYISSPIRENGELAGAVVAFSDITDRQKAEQEMHRLNRALMAMSQCNEKLIRAEDEERLIKDICEIIVKTGGYLFAWAGCVAVNRKVEIKPVAYAGEDHGFFEKLPEIWRTTEKKEGPVRRAVRSGKPALIRNLKADRRFIPWKEEALKSGFSALAAYPLRVHGQVIAILCIYADAAEAFNTKEAGLMSELASDLAFGIESIRTRKARDRAEEGLHESLGRLRRAVDGTTRALALAAEARDPYTAGHQQRVAELAVAIAREMGLSGDVIDCISVASMLHDVGKISIPAEILTKPGRLSDLEMDMIKIHPEAGYNILRQVDFPWPVAEVVLQHHERLDGTGYPRGLRGRDIQTEAKVIAVADVVEAMMSHRPYRPGLGLEEALKEIEGKRGTQFDPEAVDACLRLFAEKRFEFDKAA